MRRLAKDGDGPSDGMESVDVAGRESARLEATVHEAQRPFALIVRVRAWLPHLWRSIEHKDHVQRHQHRKPTPNETKTRAGLKPEGLTHT